MKLLMTRDDGYEVHHLSTRTCSPEEGTWTVLKYELGYGGIVTHVSEDVVHFQTNVMGKVDKTIAYLENNEDKMFMFTMLSYWHSASEEVNADSEFLDRFLEATGGLPFLVAHGLPIAMGGEKVRRTLIACLKLDDKPEVLARLHEMDDKDIVAVAELVREGNTWEEALNAAG